MARALLSRGFPVTFPPSAHEPLHYYGTTATELRPAADEGMPGPACMHDASVSRAVWTHGSDGGTVPAATAAELPLNRFQPQRRSASYHLQDP